MVYTIWTVKHVIETRIIASLLNRPNIRVS